MECLNVVVCVHSPHYLSAFIERDDFLIKYFAVGYVQHPELVIFHKV